MADLRRTKNQQTMERIYSAIGEMLSEYGYEYLTMRNICERADVAYSSVYHFFGSKESLMLQYCKMYLSEVMSLNPLPENYRKGDYIREAIWPFYVYLLAIEQMGWQLALDLFHNGNEDLFWEMCGDTHVVPALEKGIANGYIENEKGHDIPAAEMIRFIIDDIKILLSGAVLNWCKLNENGKTSPSLHIMFSRIMNRYLLSWASDSFRKEVFENRDKNIGIFNPDTRSAVKLIPFAAGEK